MEDNKEIFVLIQMSEFTPSNKIDDKTDIIALQDGNNVRIDSEVLSQQIINKINPKFVERKEKGQPNGVATLDENGKVPSVQLPPLDFIVSEIPIDKQTPTPTQNGVFIPTQIGVYPNFGSLEYTQQEFDNNDDVRFIFIDGRFEKQVKSFQVDGQIKSDDVRAIGGKEVYDYTLRDIKTIAELRTIVGEENQTIRLLGYYEAGDKPPLLYKWVEGVGEDDGGSVVVVGSGYWKALFGDTIRFEDFGAKNNIVFDNSDIINKTIVYAGVNKKSVDIESINMDINKPITIDYDVTIKGNYRNSIITSKITSGYSIIISDKNSISGVIIDGLTLNGNPSNNGLKLNKGETIQKAVRDSLFTNIRLFNFGIGIASYYSWCNTFLNVRTQSCRTPFIGGNQTNNTLFLRCSFANGNKTMTFTNCEGIEFNTCNFANYNLNNDGDANIMSLYQSNVMITNPYYEYLNNAHFNIGSTNEVLKSTFISVGGKSTDDSVRVRMSGYDNTIICYGLNSGSKFEISNKNIAPTSYTSNNLVKLDNKREELFVFNGIGKIKLPKYGSGTLLEEAYSAGSVLFKSTNSTGYRLSNTLVVGDVYTLIINMNKISGGLIVRHGGQTNNLENGNHIFYFRATAVDIYIHSSSSIESEVEIKSIKLLKNSVNDFNSVSYEKHLLTTDVSNGYWNIGDTYFLKNETSVIQRVCTKSGVFGSDVIPVFSNVTNAI